MQGDHSRAVSQAGTGGLALLLMQGTRLFIAVSLSEDSVDRPVTSFSSSKHHSTQK